MNNLSQKKGRWSKAFIYLAIIIGIFFRVYKIDTVPYGINHDGAWGGLWAIELSQKPWPIQVFSDQGWLGEAMPRYIIAIFIKLFGPTIFSLRMGIMLFSILSLPAFYLLVKLLFDNYLLALSATFLLAASGWDITYAKSGWATSSVPVTNIITLYFLLKAVKSRKIFFYALTGISLAVAFNTYRGSPLPFLILGVFLWQITNQRKKYKQVISSYAVFLIAFIISISPLALYAINHWDNYTGRQRSLYVGYRIQKEGNLNPLIQNIKKTALMYNLHGGGDDFFIKEPLLDFPTNWLFLIGLTATIIQFTKKESRFLLFWFISSLIPCLASVPNGNHGIASLPPVYIFSGIGLFTLYNLISKSKIAKKNNIHNLFIFLILSSAAITTFNLYLSPNRHELWGFYPETTVVGNYMKPRVPYTDFYITDNYPRDALTYLTYQGGDPWQKHYTWFERGSLFLTVTPNPAKDTSFVMLKLPENQTLMEKLKQQYPGGIEGELIYKDDGIERPAAWIFTLPKVNKPSYEK